MATLCCVRAHCSVPASAKSFGSIGTIQQRPLLPFPTADCSSLRGRQGEQCPHCTLCCGGLSCPHCCEVWVLVLCILLSFFLALRSSKLKARVRARSASETAISTNTHILPSLSAAGKHLYRTEILSVPAKVQGVYFQQKSPSGSTTSPGILSQISPSRLQPPLPRRLPQLRPRYLVRIRPSKPISFF